MSTAIQDLKDKIELDVLRRINDLERDVEYLRNKVLYDIPSKSEWKRESSDISENVKFESELVAELQIQNALLKSQIKDLRTLLSATKPGFVAQRVNEVGDEGYW